jgi:sigma-B regulation protein RsbU (phosphoserine phosphatase)
VNEVDIALEPGDQLLLYTDGVTEAMDPQKRQFGLNRLQAFLAEHGHRSPAELIDSLKGDLARHVQSADPHDDITLIALRRRI